MSVQPAQLIEVYERILAASARMLACARSGEWDLLTEEEKACRGEIDSLQFLGDEAPQLPPELRARKLDIVRQVIADDAEIRRLVEPRMAQLDQLLGNVRNARRLTRAYG